MLQAIRNGLTEVVPSQVLLLFTHRQLAELIAGTNNDAGGAMAQLRQRAMYSGGLSPEHPVVQRLWRVLEGMVEPERQLVLRFLFGLPPLHPPAQLARETSACAHAAACLPLLPRVPSRPQAARLSLPARAACFTGICDRPFPSIRVQPPPPPLRAAGIGSDEEVLPLPVMHHHSRTLVLPLYSSLPVMHRQLLRASIRAREQVGMHTRVRQPSDASAARGGPTTDTRR